MREVFEFILKDLAKLEQSLILWGIATLSALVGFVDILFYRSKYIFATLSKTKQLLFKYHWYVAFILLSVFILKTVFYVGVIADNNSALAKCAIDLNELQNTCQ